MRASDNPPLSSADINLGRDQSYPIVPCTPISSTLPSLSLNSAASTDGALPVSLGTLGLLPYPLDIRGEPAYLRLGRHKGGPDRNRLILVPLQLLPYIGNLLTDPSNGLVLGFELYIPGLYHHPLGLIDLPYYRFGPVPGTAPLPLFRIQPLPNIPLPPQHGIKPLFQIHVRQFLLPLSLLGVHICASFADLGLIDGSVDLGPKFVPCLLHFPGRPPTEGPPRPFHLLHCPLYPKSLLTTHYLSIFILKNSPLLPPHILVTF